MEQVTKVQMREDEKVDLLELAGIKIPPKLSGSYKQVAWGESIRITFLAELGRAVVSLKKDDFTTYQVVLTTALNEFLTNNKDSAFWIRNQHKEIGLAKQLLERVDELVLADITVAAEIRNNNKNDKIQGVVVVSDEVEEPIIPVKKKRGKSETKVEMHPMVRAIVEQLITRRFELKLTQAFVGKKSGIGQVSLSRIEKLVKVPQLDTVCKVAESLGMDLALLIK